MRSIPRLAARLAIAVALVAIPSVAIRSHAAAASCPGVVASTQPTSSVTVQLIYDVCSNTIWTVTSDSQGNGGQEIAYEADVDTAYDTIFAPDNPYTDSPTHHESAHQTASCTGQYYGYGVISYSNGPANPPDDVVYRTGYYAVNCGY